MNILIRAPVKTTFILEPGMKKYDSGLKHFDRVWIIIKTYTSLFVLFYLCNHGEKNIHREK